MESTPKKKAAPKKRTQKYDTKLSINGTLEDVLKASFKPKEITHPLQRDN